MRQFYGSAETSDSALILENTLDQGVGRDRCSDKLLRKALRMSQFYGSAIQRDRQLVENRLVAFVFGRWLRSMRHSRWLAPWKDSSDKSAIYHCLSRVVDRCFVLGDVEREQFRKFMRMQEKISLAVECLLTA
jgi:hypothetical protein